MLEGDLGALNIRLEKGHCAERAISLSDVPREMQCQRFTCAYQCQFNVQRKFARLIRRDISCRIEPPVKQGLKDSWPLLAGSTCLTRIAIAILLSIQRLYERSSESVGAHVYRLPYQTLVDRVKSFRIVVRTRTHISRGSFLVRLFHKVFAGNAIGVRMEQYLYNSYASVLPLCGTKTGELLYADRIFLF